MKRGQWHCQSMYSLITEMIEKKIVCRRQASNTRKFECSWVGKNVLKLKQTAEAAFAGFEEDAHHYSSEQKGNGWERAKSWANIKLEKCMGLEVERPNGEQKPKFPPKLRGGGQEKQGKKGAKSCKRKVCWNLGGLKNK
ncbi:hypothetical protein HAX54_032384 [Datura stramonium]|uniref:Uncharacterized protein n=1 Tax=Datura stramonium TaxID=4076 RepID=A0ABS8VD02_DATST|nr:hypothetical protein [Datura stramonium]